MSGSNLTVRYSWRLVRREWRRFVLPFFSLGVTAIVLILILLLSTASNLFLAGQARELLGGDVTLESTLPIDTGAFWGTAGILPEAESRQLSFSATLEAASTTAPFSLKIVDGAYPLYGRVTLESGEFRGIGDGDMYLDQGGADKLGVHVGDEVSFGSARFTVAGIIQKEPTSLLSSFRFLPRAMLSEAGFARAGVDPALLRIEYQYAAKVSNLNNNAKERLATAAANSNGAVDVDIAGESGQGVVRGLGIVTDFLVIAVLITAVLAAVNVYASTLYLITIEKRSLTIMLALGMPRRRLIAILGAALLYVVVLASVVGVFVGAFLFSLLQNYIAVSYSIMLLTPDTFVLGMITLTLVAVIAVAAFFPAVRNTFALHSQRIFATTDETTVKQSFPIRTIFLLTIFSLVPLILLAAFLLKDIVLGTLVIGGAALLYLTVAAMFALLLRAVYRRRGSFSFFTRSIISQKKADGLFGMVSFTSLFVALTALSTLTLLQISLERYLTEDLTRTVPSTYVLDVQPSQRDLLQSRFPETELFLSIPARIIAIDDVRIQEELEKPDTTVDRELGREFNVTARPTLLSSETITKGEWGNGARGEISVDEDFAGRAGIELGSRVEFTIQGFPVSGTVTSFRNTDSRSGLPFFYFVLSPEDIASFPGVYFGYAYYDADTRAELGRYLAKEAPNVSMLETEAVGELLTTIVRTLLVMVLVVALPPLLIATLLVATMIVSSYIPRQREGSRLRALGATRSFVFRQYVAETVSLTLAASILAYVSSVGIGFLISRYFLRLDRVTLFDTELVAGLGLIVAFVAVIAVYLFATGKQPLRTLLSYGE